MFTFRDRIEVPGFTAFDLCLPRRSSNMINLMGKVWWSKMSQNIYKTCGGDLIRITRFSWRTNTLIWCRQSKYVVQITSPSSTYPPTPEIMLLCIGVLLYQRRALVICLQAGSNPFTIKEKNKDKLKSWQGMNHETIGRVVFFAQKVSCHLSAINF